MRALQNRDGVSSPPWVWISICAVGWQLQTSLSADGFDQCCRGSIVANEGTGACELLCPSLLMAVCGSTNPPLAPMTADCVSQLNSVLKSDSLMKYFLFIYTTPQIFYLHFYLIFRHEIVSPLFSPFYLLFFLVGHSFSMQLQAFKLFQIHHKNNYSVAFQYKQ